MDYMKILPVAIANPEARIKKVEYRTSDAKMSLKYHEKLHFSEFRFGRAHFI